MYGPHHSKLELSREHVIPKGLGGGIIVLKGSCEDCRKTAAIENECLHKNWKLFRAINDFDISSDKPTEAPIVIVDDDRRSEKLVPLKDHPNILVMPFSVVALAYSLGNPRLRESASLVLLMLPMPFGACGDILTRL
jgi:hypothetical protein